MIMIARLDPAAKWMLAAIFEIQGIVGNREGTSHVCPGEI